MTVVECAGRYSERVPVGWWQLSTFWKCAGEDFRWHHVNACVYLSSACFSCHFWFWLIISYFSSCFIITKFASVKYRKKKKMLKRYIPYIPVCVWTEPSHVFSGVNSSAWAGTPWVFVDCANGWAEPNLISYPIFSLFFNFHMCPTSRRVFIQLHLLLSQLQDEVKWWFFSFFFFFFWESWLLKSLEFCGAVKFFLYLCSSCKSLIKAQYRQYVEVM